MPNYLPLQKAKFIFAAEDCTAVVPKIIYDVPLNTFIGFARLTLRMVRRKLMPFQLNLFLNSKTSFVRQLNLIYLIFI